MFYKMLPNICPIFRISIYIWIEGTQRDDIVECAMNWRYWNDGVVMSLDDILYTVLIGKMVGGDTRRATSTDIRCL